VFIARYGLGLCKECRLVFRGLNVGRQRHCNILMPEGKEEEPGVRWKKLHSIQEGNKIYYSGSSEAMPGRPSGKGKL